MSSPSLSGDDVLDVFFPGMEAFKSFVWLMENYSTFICVIGFLIVAIFMFRGVFHLALAMALLTLLLGGAPKIASIFFFN